VSEVILVVLPNNVRAVRCYLKAGLTQRGEEWKREPWSSGPYRMVRMGIERAGFERIISGLVR
jgi:RimJ/RimL family protein N-acetyltransferase